MCQTSSIQQEELHANDKQKQKDAVKKARKKHIVPWRFGFSCFFTSLTVPRPLEVGSFPLFAVVYTSQVSADFLA